MAFNLIAETEELINWKILRDELFKSKYEYINIFPIANAKGINSIGISVPISNLNEYCREELNILLYQLLSEFQFKVYELYDGEEITVDSIDKLKKLIGFKI